MPKLCSHPLDGNAWQPSFYLRTPSGKLETLTQACRIATHNDGG